MAAEQRDQAGPPAPEPAGPPAEDAGDATETADGSAEATTDGTTDGAADGAGDGAGDGAAEDVKARFREALARKRKHHTPHAAGAEGESKLHGPPEPTARRQFRRKSSP